MKIIEFKHENKNEAIQIALENQEAERKYVPELPKIATIPDLSHFADNGLGVAAFEADQMIGYLGAYDPLEDAFGTTDIKGTFSPIHAHGVISSERFTALKIASHYDKNRIYSLLYQEAAKKWIQKGRLSHAIALYAHDAQAIESFFWNGFGLRCVDAICSLGNIPFPIDTTQITMTDFEYNELPQKEWGLLLDCQNALITHLGNSPSFMTLEQIDEYELFRRSPKDARYFVVKTGGVIIAYIKIAEEGENYISDYKGILNICGAYCNPSYRGIGIYHNLLCHVMNVLKGEGYQLLGVDFESFNPTARGFWKKYFIAYTHSVVRRIDDKAVKYKI